MGHLAGSMVQVQGCSQLQYLCKKQERKKHSDLTSCPAIYSHWLNPLSKHRAKGPMDRVYAAEHPENKMSLKVQRIYMF